MDFFCRLFGRKADLFCIFLEGNNLFACYFWKLNPLSTIQFGLFIIHHPPTSLFSINNMVCYETKQFWKLHYYSTATLRTHYHHYLPFLFSKIEIKYWLDHLFLSKCYNNRIVKSNFELCYVLYFCTFNW